MVSKGDKGAHSSNRWSISGQANWQGSLQGSPNFALERSHYKHLALGRAKPGGAQAYLARPKVIHHAEKGRL